MTEIITWAAGYIVAALIVITLLGKWFKSRAPWRSDIGHRSASIWAAMERDHHKTEGTNLPRGDA